MRRRMFLQVAAATLAPPSLAPGFVLQPDDFRHQVDYFNGMAPEGVIQFIPDAQAFTWMRNNIPLFTCPDPEVEQIYYFRWWVFRKHVKQTPAGFIVTEFLQPVKHAGEYNALSCAFGHHVAEGRWLHERRFIEQYIHFWLRTGENGGLRANFHQFSGWAAAALYERSLADGASASPYLDALLGDYRAWEKERLLPDGLFWQRDVADGMEESISGGRHVKNVRPSINSYMYGNARAIAAIALQAGRDDLAREFDAKASRLGKLVEERLWNRADAFFETRLESGKSAAVREEIGYTAWLFDLPEPGKGYAQAWKQLRDPRGFYRVSWRTALSGSRIVASCTSSRVTRPAVRRSRAATGVSRRFCRCGKILTSRRRAKTRCSRTRKSAP